MNCKVTLWISLVSMMALGASAAGAAVVTVVGQDDPSVDRQNIQDALDSAVAGTTLSLVGTFRLDGERIVLRASGLTLEGEEVDNDGDGQAQEDWVDGQDNDGDGQVDEDDWETRILGVDAGDGSPVLNDGSNGLFNRAFVVDGVDGELRDLTIRQLAFSTFHRAIELIPEWFSATGRCEDRVAVDGALRRVRIESNKFENAELGITLLGDIRNSTVEKNVFLDNRVFGAVLEGGEIRCPLANGSFVELALTTPRHNRILANTGVGASLATAVSFQSWLADNDLEDGTIFSLGDRSARLTGNTVRQSFAGLIIDGGEQVRADRNRSLDCFEGIEVTGAAEQVIIQDNEIAGAFIGLEFFDASGFFAINNHFTGTLLIDVELFFGTTGNTVINAVGPAITVFDLGTDNRLIGDIILF